MLSGKATEFSVSEDRMIYKGLSMLLLSSVKIATTLQLKIQTAAVLHILHVMRVISSTYVRLFWKVWHSLNYWW